MRYSARDETDERLSPEEKKQAVQVMQYRQEKMVSTGKAIVYTIAIINIVFSVIDLAIGSSGFISLIIQVVFSVALMTGARWARVLFVIGMGLSAVISLYALLSYGHTSAFANIVFLLLLVYSVVGCVILFASKSVGEFMYWAKNG